MQHDDGASMVAAISRLENEGRRQRAWADSRLLAGPPRREQLLEARLLGRRWHPCETQLVQARHRGQKRRGAVVHCRGRERVRVDLSRAPQREETPWSVHFVWFRCVGAGVSACMHRVRNRCQLRTVRGARLASCSSQSGTCGEKFDWLPPLRFGGAA